MNTLKDYSAIPAELKALPRWVLFRLAPKNGKVTKIPVQASGRAASSTDPATWTTFEKAVAASTRFDGIGFMFDGSGYAGIDLDHCVDSGGVIEPWAETIIDSFATYAEFSVSVTGVHLICKGQFDGPGRKHGGIEAYCRSRFFCTTGKTVPGSVPTIEDRQDELTAFIARVFPADKPQDAPRKVASAPSSLSDTDLLTKAMAAKNGAAFSALWRGDISGHQNDASRADLSLCCHLAFWTGNDGGAIDRLFRTSALCREDKWVVRGDYRERTIARAIACTSKTYEPRGEEVTGNLGGKPQGAAQSQETAQEGTEEAQAAFLHGVMPFVAAKLAGLPVDVLPMGLRVHENATDKAFREIVHRLIKVKNVTECPLHLSLGDVYNQLPAKYGTRRQWVDRYGQGLQMQFRKWGHVAGQWPQELRRPGIPWSFYAEGAKVSESEKKLMIDKHDAGNRPTVSEVRAQPAEMPKAKLLPKDLKSALASLIESKGEAFVKDLLLMAGSGALDEFMAGENETEENAKNDDFPSKHCSESEQFDPEKWPDFSDDFDVSFSDSDAPPEPIKPTSGNVSRSAERLQTATAPRSASNLYNHTGGSTPAGEPFRYKDCVNTAEQSSPRDVASPGEIPHLRTSADYESNGYSERFRDF